MAQRCCNRIALATVQTQVRVRCTPERPLKLQLLPVPPHQSCAGPAYWYHLFHSLHGLPVYLCMLLKLQLALQHQVRRLCAQQAAGTLCEGARRHLPGLAKLCLPAADHALF